MSPEHGSKLHSQVEEILKKKNFGGLNDKAAQQINEILARKDLDNKPLANEIELFFLDHTVGLILTAGIYSFYYIGEGWNKAHEITPKMTKKIRDIWSRFR